MSDAKADVQEIVIVLAPWQPYIHLHDSIVKMLWSEERVTRD